MATPSPACCSFTAASVGSAGGVPLGFGPEGMPDGGTPVSLGGGPDGVPEGGGGRSLSSARLTFATVSVAAGGCPEIGKPDGGAPVGIGPEGSPGVPEGGGPEKTPDCGCPGGDKVPVPLGGAGRVLSAGAATAASAWARTKIATSFMLMLFVEEKNGFVVIDKEVNRNSKSRLNVQSKEDVCCEG